MQDYSIGVTNRQPRRGFLFLRTGASWGDYCYLAIRFIFGFGHHVGDFPTYQCRWVGAGNPL